MLKHEEFWLESSVNDRLHVLRYMYMVTTSQRNRNRDPIFRFHNVAYQCPVLSTRDINFLFVHQNLNSSYLNSILSAPPSPSPIFAQGNAHSITRS